MTAQPLTAETTDTFAPSVSFQRYYEEAGPDYATWSPAYNMHFGYFRAGLNPLQLEPMLEQMNREILTRLHVDTLAAPRIVDLGCGLGATLRSIARQLPHAVLTGVTLVPWQRDHGTHLNRTGPQADAATRNIRLLLADYERTALPPASADAVYALESSCYAHGAGKSAFLAEAHRLLRPGGRLVVADGFLARPNALHGPQRALYRRLCDCWVIETLGEIHAFTAELTRLGFRDIHVEPAQLRVGLSVLHVPIVTLRFLLHHLLHAREPLSRARWNNLLAPILLPFVSKPFGPMGYYIVSATRG